MTTIRDLRRAGFEGLRIECPKCRKITIHWWQTLHQLQLDGATIDDNTQRLRCQQCGSRSRLGDVQPYRHSDSQPTMAQMLGTPPKRS
jgi:hypothetical protein